MENLKLTENGLKAKKITIDNQIAEKRFDSSKFACITLLFIAVVDPFLFFYLEKNLWNTFGYNIAFIIILIVIVMLLRTLLQRKVLNDIDYNFRRNYIIKKINYQKEELKNLKNFITELETEEVTKKAKALKKVQDEIIKSGRNFIK